MPIYAYKCESCGYAKDALQKMSDAPLTDCPHCGASTFKKQLTAAGFQLKGSGWYVTDFRGGNNGAPANGAPASSKAADSGSGADGKSTEAGTAAAAVPAAAATPAPSAASAAPAGNPGAGSASSKTP
ncbi:MAG: zinc ribbon domain-containing protein [Pseudomonadota bacterium]|nr:zinc ribbon domain-containing protein [Pseudomonadota bacterium]